MLGERTSCLVAKTAIGPRHDSHFLAQVGYVTLRPIAALAPFDKVGQRANPTRKERRPPPLFAAIHVFRQTLTQIRPCRRK